MIFNVCAMRRGAMIFNVRVVRRGAVILYRVRDLTDSVTCAQREGGEPNVHELQALVL